LYFQHTAIHHHRNLDKEHPRRLSAWHWHGDIITVIERGMLICDKIKSRNEPITGIANRMTSLQRYLKPLEELLEGRNDLAR
jgi:hypothetical protein